MKPSKRTFILIVQICVVKFINQPAINNASVQVKQPSFMETGDIVDTRRIPFPLVFDHFIIDQYWLFPEDEFCVCSWVPKTNSNLANVIRLLNGTKLNWICHDIWHVELRGYEFWSWRVKYLRFPDGSTAPTASPESNVGLLKFRLELHSSVSLLLTSYWERAP